MFSLVASAEHSSKQINILIVLAIVIPILRQDSTLSVHHGGMIKSRALLSAFIDSVRTGRHSSLGDDIIRCAYKLLDVATHNC